MTRKKPTTCRCPTCGKWDVFDFDPNKVTFNGRKKFDFQLNHAIIRERSLAEIFCSVDIHKVELKTETFQWETTGNIAIEIENRRKPAGLTATESGCWAHELRRQGETLCHILFPMNRLRALCYDAMRNGQIAYEAGDSGASTIVLLRLSDILK